MNNRVVLIDRKDYARGPSRQANFWQRARRATSFGGLTDDERPYSSRRIALTTENKPVEILGGTRLTAVSEKLETVSQHCRHRGLLAQTLDVTLCYFAETFE